MGCREPINLVNWSFPRPKTCFSFPEHLRETSLRTFSERALCSFPDRSSALAVRALSFPVSRLTADVTGSALSTLHAFTLLGVETATLLTRPGNPASAGSFPEEDRQPPNTVGVVGLILDLTDVVRLLLWGHARKLDPN